MERHFQLEAAIEGLIADSEDRSLPEPTPRRLELPGLTGKADVVVGMRRVGKTWLVFQEMRRRLAEGIPRERLLYLNFEDERLLPMDADDLHLVPDVFYRRHPASRHERSFFYFDEIQNVPGWERFVRRLLDSENVQIVLTGSSAKLLSREIATSLRGRSLSTELLPFSFAEALRHEGVELPKRLPPPARLRSLLENRLGRYLEVGGFPEVQDVDPELRLRILKDYIDVVLLRDVAERHGIENLAALRYLERALLSRPAGRFSVHRLYNDLKSQGVAVGKNTLYEYLEYLEDAFLLFTIPIASRSLRVRRSNPKKVYPVDPALAGVVSFQASRDVGHKLENVVYLELRRRGFEVAYLKTDDGFEVDFLAEHPRREPELIQVSAHVGDSKTRERELRALGPALSEGRKRRATLVTLHESGEVALDHGRKVRIVPAWRWLLEDLLDRLDAEHGPADEALVEKHTELLS